MAIGSVRAQLHLFLMRARSRLLSVLAPLLTGRVTARALSTSPTTLDPTDWSSLRASAHALLDASFDKMENAKEGRVWTPPPDSLKQELQESLPVDGMDVDQVSARLKALLPYGVGNTHPRFFGWVHGSGSPSGVLAEMVAVAMNANCGGRDHAAIYVEKQVLSWCRSIMGFPADCGGLLVSGTSMATIVALKAARDLALDAATSRKQGLIDAQKARGRLVGYAASGTHSCVAQAFDVLGMGTEALRLVPVKADFTMDAVQLDEMIRADVAAGLTPFVIVGTAGSVNVGAIDDLSALADLADVHGVWLHVDGAFGACGVLCDEVRPRLSGMERASSLAFDFHKWMHVNYDCGYVHA